MSLRRQLGNLLREAEEMEKLLDPKGLNPSGDLYGWAYNTEVRFFTLRKFAQFAYLAEQYGYRYAGLDPDSGGAHTPRFDFHRLPDAPARTAHMTHHYPDAPYAGRLPGLSAWPLPRLARPKARAEVRLLHARIVIDYFGAFRTEPLRPYFIAIPAVFLIALVVNGNEPTLVSLGITVGIAAFLLVLLLASRLYMRYRRTTYQKRLERAGTPWPPT